jgi:hypothetical protein
MLVGQNKGVHVSVRLVLPNVIYCSASNSISVISSYHKLGANMTLLPKATGQYHRDILV